MTRRQLGFIILVNALISLVIALAVTWIVEMRRPDPEELAALVAPQSMAVLAPTPTPGSLAVLPTPGTTLLPAAPSQAAAPGTLGAGQVYIVQPGDSLLSIAGRFGVTLDALVQANDLANPDFVFSGQRLVIPGGVAAGETPAAQSPPAAPGGVIIAAVEGLGDLNKEVVLLVNESNTPVNLQGWRLERENGPAYTFGNAPLFPGGSLRIYSGSGENNTIAVYWRQAAAVWSAGAVARLTDGEGATVHSMTVGQ